MVENKGKNKGEWSELYIFFKLMSDRKVYMADKDLNTLKQTFLNIISIIREEQTGQEYRYFTGDNVIITLNGKEVLQINTNEFAKNAGKLWNMIKTNPNTTFTDKEIEAFLKEIFIKNISSPAKKKNEYFGGTADIVLDTMDYRSGVNQILGFSCKSDIDSASTLFNASGDNTNFEYELVGNINDEIMDKFNSIYKEVSKKGELKKEVAIAERIEFLKTNKINLKFISPVKENTKNNLVRCGGLEMPAIVGEMLRYNFFDKQSSSVSLENAIEYLGNTDPVRYGFENLYETYKVKVSNLLYSMFTGLRFSKPWNGKSDVSGGYIVVKRDGEVVAFHSCITDEFKDFLVSKLKFEAPSCSRHDYMKIYKKDDKYYIKFALQFRFKLKK